MPTRVHHHVQALYNEQRNIAKRVHQLDACLNDERDRFLSTMTALQLQIQHVGNMKLSRLNPKSNHQVGYQTPADQTLLTVTWKRQRPSTAPTNRRSPELHPRAYMMKPGPRLRSLAN